MDLKSYIGTIPDYPSPGIVFRDICPLLASPKALARVVSLMTAEWQGRIDGIAALDARGFVFAGALAHSLALPLAMIRKKGKLPGETFSTNYSLEYGHNEIEIQAHAFPKGSHVLIIDDVLATGGTAAAAGDLIEQIGSTIAGYTFVIELEGLKGREKLKEVPIQSLIKY